VRAVKITLEASMRRRSAKHGSASASPFILDLDQLEAEFWSRPAEQIHTDLQSPLNWPIAVVEEATKKGLLSRAQKADLSRAFTSLQFPDDQRRRLQTVKRVLASRSDAEQQLAKGLPFRVVERWVLAPPDQRDQAMDWIMAGAIGRLGPDAFLLKAVHAHLTALWRLMHSAPTVAERTAAKKRWLYITRAGLPNLRAFKEPRHALDVAAATEKIAEALRLLAPLRKRRWHTKDLDELTRRLTATFSDWRWPPHILKKLAEGIIDRHSDTVRAMIQAGVGRPLGQGHTGLRDALANERRRAKEQGRRKDTIARIAAGKRRYAEWLTREGLEPHPAVLDQLKNPPKMS
jgi:hypothetical protein